MTYSYDIDDKIQLIVQCTIISVCMSTVSISVQSTVKSLSIQTHDHSYREILYSSSKHNNCFAYITITTHNYLLYLFLVIILFILY